MLGWWQYSNKQLNTINYFSRSPKYAKNPKDKDENKIKEEKESKKVRVCRHLILIRHGQYNLDGFTDFQKNLTELGKYPEHYWGIKQTNKYM